MDRNDLTPTAPMTSLLGQPPAATPVAAPVAAPVAMAGTYPAGTYAPPTTSRTATGAGTVQRQGRVRLTRVDPWSVLTVTLVFSVLMALIWVATAMLLYVAVDRMGAVASINDLYNTLIKPYTGPGEPPAGPVTGSRVALVVALVGAVGTVVTTTVATVGAFMYNSAAKLTKGLRGTLVELD